MNFSAGWEVDTVLGFLESGRASWRAQSEAELLCAPPSPPSDAAFERPLPPPEVRPVAAGVSGAAASRGGVGGSGEGPEASVRGGGGGGGLESKARAAEEAGGGGDGEGAGDGVLEIVREGVGEQGSTREEGGGGGKAKSLLHEELSARMHVTLFLPDKRRVQLRLQEQSTVQDTIGEALRRFSHLKGSADCYELRVHDTDGEPEEGFPSLERMRLLKAFAGAGAEYCLVELPSVMRAWMDEHGSESSGVVGGGGGGVGGGGGGGGGDGDGEERGRAFLAAEAAFVPPDRWVVLVFVPREGLPPASVVLLPTLDEVANIREDAEVEGGVTMVLGGGASAEGEKGGKKRGRGSTAGSIFAKAGSVVPALVRKPNAVVSDVLGDLVVRLRLPVFSERYDLRVSEGDQVRLHLPSPILPPATSLRTLKLWGGAVLKLQRTAFADAPRRDHHSSSSSSSSAAPPHLPLRESPSSPQGVLDGKGRMGRMGRGGMDVLEEEEEEERGGGDRGGGMVGHTIVTASAFKEWRVIKINQFGRRQERLMGVDIARITNRKIPDKRRWGASNTRTAERLITNVQRVLVPDPRAQGAPASSEKARETARRQITIEFREGDDDVVITYETETAAQRDEIANKLAYILRLNNDADRLVFVPLRPKP